MYSTRTESFFTSREARQRNTQPLESSSHTLQGQNREQFIKLLANNEIITSNQMNKGEGCQETTTVTIPRQEFKPNFDFLKFSRNIKENISSHSLKFNATSRGGGGTAQGANQSQSSFLYTRRTQRQTVLEETGSAVLQSAIMSKAKSSQREGAGDTVRTLKSAAGMDGSVGGSIGYRRSSTAKGFTMKRNQRQNMLLLLANKHFKEETSQQAYGRELDVEKVSPNSRNHPQPGSHRNIPSTSYGALRGTTNTSDLKRYVSNYSNERLGPTILLKQDGNKEQDNTSLSPQNYYSAKLNEKKNLLFATSRGESLQTAVHVSRRQRNKKDNRGSQIDVRAAYRDSQHSLEKQKKRRLIMTQRPQELKQTSISPNNKSPSSHRQVNQKLNESPNHQKIIKPSLKPTDVNITSQQENQKTRNHIVGLSALTAECNQDLGQLYMSISNLKQLQSLDEVATTELKHGKDVLKVDAVSMLKSTNKEMKTLLHNLNKVIKTTGEDFHRQIYEGLPTECEVMDGGSITQNLKVTLKDMNPPCILHFSYMGGEANAGKEHQRMGRTGEKMGETGSIKTKGSNSGSGDLVVFVSRLTKDPNESNNQGKHINPHKIVIYPNQETLNTSGRPDLTAQPKQFKEVWLYITLSSHTGCRVKISATFKREKISSLQQKLQQNQATNGVPNAGELISPAGQQPRIENRYLELEELAEVHSMAAFKKKKEIFEKQLNLLINDSNLFRDFRDKMQELKKKRADQQRRQTTGNKGSRLRLLSGSTGSPRGEGEGFEPESIIDRNMNLIPHFKQYDKERRFLMSQLTAHQQQKARSLRDQLSQERREKHIFNLYRWVFFRQQSEEKRLQQELEKQKAQNALFWIRHVICLRRLKVLAENIDFERDQVIQRIKTMLRVRRIQNQFRRLIMKRGPSKADRAFNIFRFGAVALHMFVTPSVEEEAKEKLVDFLRVYSKKFFIKVKFKIFFARLMKVQTRLKSYVHGMRGRMEFLRKMWDKEHQQMVMQIAKIKTKTKKQKEFLARVRAIPDTVKEAVLVRYLDKCKNQNAVEFFKWHRQLYGNSMVIKPDPTLSKEEQDEIVTQEKKRRAQQSLLISMRLSTIRHHENTLFQNTEDQLQQIKDLKRDEVAAAASGSATAKAQGGHARKTLKQSTFITEANSNPQLEELLRQTPFIFQFVPAKSVMQKMIIKASQVKNAKEIEIVGGSPSRH